MTEVDLDGVLSGLKDFQRATVDHVVDRFFDPVEPSRRFLVADEVGLGKTHVARGVIAHLLDKRSRSGKERIDVVYVCANSNIARQNIRKLNVLPGTAFVQATRLTLLPRELPGLSANRVNFLSLTPGTSLDPRSSEGMAEERAVLFRILQGHWGHDAFSHRVPKHIFRVGAGYDRFMYRLSTVDADELDSELVAAFRQRLDDVDREAAAAGEPTLRERFEDLKDRWRRRPGLTREERRLQRRFIGELRGHLAQACVGALQPDLVILDEFQRFKRLLDRDTEAGELAEHLFAARDSRVLLLSATPYRMYSTAHDDEAPHYEDFIDTYRFLAGDEAGSALERELDRYRSALLAVGANGTGELREAKEAVETRLRRVIARTERLAVRGDRDGMLAHVESPGLRVAPTEVAQFLELDGLARRAGAHGTLEYWRSAPYLLSFMDDYVFARRVREVLRGDPAAVRALDDTGALLPMDEIRGYEQLEPDSARLRSLLADTVEQGAWQWLWLPPTRPHYRLESVYAGEEAKRFTKRLVFSSWQVVPKMLAALLSYEAERRMMHQLPEVPDNTPAARERHARLLQFQASGGRLTGMPVLALLYPSVALARLADPLLLGGGEASLAEVRADAESKIASALDPIVARHADYSAEADARWFWAAPLLLDQAHDPATTEHWWDRRGLAGWWRAAESGEEPADEAGRWAEHVERGRELLAGEVPLGAPPDGLAGVVADLALAGPGVCALRALDRVTDRNLVADPATRDDAGRIAWGFRTLFNLPEVTALVRSSDPQRPYWQAVLHYAAAGGIQAMLDEYAHVLTEWLGVAEADDHTRMATLADHARQAMSMRAPSYRVHDVASRDGQRPTLRGRFALRFGERGAQGERVGRQEQERAAFNSPFWPFVLATTSVGQEGLDFHQYCHAVVHWNLPSNPIDLEQREGRVHRYKGHAVRKNIALHHGGDGDAA